MSSLREMIEQVKIENQNLKADIFQVNIELCILKEENRLLKIGLTSQTNKVQTLEKLIYKNRS